MRRLGGAAEALPDLSVDAAHEERLSDSDMRRIAALVYETTGIVLDDSRHALVVGRLGKRLRALKISSYHEYVRLLFERDKDGAELGNLVNAITTNKTSFFREAHHFTYLKERIEERMRAAEGRPELRRLAIWSAACSTGEEPYSIAMTVADTLGSDLSSWRVQIFATDIDTDVLAFAERGVYGRERTQGLPASVAHHFAQSQTPTGAPALRVSDELRDLITFRKLNFMDASWGALRGPFDHIFCRNVTIYFDRPTQARLYPRLAALLAGDGSFYAGHSENLTWLPELFRPEGLTVYSLTNGRAAHAPPARKGPPPLPTMAAQTPAPTPLPPARIPSPPARTPLVSVAQSRQSLTSAEMSRTAMPARAPSASLAVRGSAPDTPEVLGTPRAARSASLAPTRERLMSVAPSTTSLKRPWTAEIAEQALQAGDVLVSVEPKILRTTLGSCVSVCMYDPIAKVGGMNHFMLPGAGDALETSTRFGLQAMEMLINKLLKIGAERHRLIAKIAGACKVLDVSPAAGNVSDRNLAFVDEFLSTEGFEVKGRRVGGTSALEVRFRTDTGEAFVRAVDPRWTQQVVIEDRAYAKRLVVPLPKPDDDGITWFR